MTKPDWKDAPEWAMWLAQDEGGEWWWYEGKPIVMRDRHEVDCLNYQCLSRAIKAATENQDWKSTLERRP